MRVKVGGLTLTPAHKAVVNKVLASNQLSPGPTCREFEKAFAKEENAKHALFVNSGTDALRIALEALKEKYGWKPGDEVICPSLTFVATLNVILQVGLKPILVDIGMYDLNINPSNLQRRLETGRPQNLRAIIPVHLLGQRCDMDQILAVAKDRKLRVLEDSCETVGVGGLEGDIACYSTYVCHLMTTGVGGLAVTNDQELSNLMRSFANHGRSVGYLPGVPQESDITKRFRFDRIGYSARPTEIEAALGLIELKNLQKNISRRRVIASKLWDGLSPFSQLRFVSATQSAFMMFPIILREGSTLNKWTLCKFLEKSGIETREILPLTNQPCYKHLKINPKDFPVADWVNKNGFYVGCHPGMKDSDVTFVIETFRRFFDGKNS